MFCAVDILQTAAHLIQLRATHSPDTSVRSGVKSSVLVQIGDIYCKIFTGNYKTLHLVMRKHGAVANPSKSFNMLILNKSINKMGLREFQEIKEIPQNQTNKSL